MSTPVLIVERQKPLPKVTGRGRKKGSGSNLKLLASLKPGDSIWDIPEKKAMSICFSAYKAKIKISRRRIPGTELYAISKLQEKKD
jgi:hypothetical protein